MGYTVKSTRDMLRQLATGLAVVAILASCAAEPPVSENVLTVADGLAAYNRGDYTMALKILKPLASEDQPDAAYILGEIYAYAQGVPQDYSEAYHWYLVGGRFGNPRAQMVLGSLTGGGLGVARSYRRSLEWYQCVVENEKSSTEDRYWAGIEVRTAFSVHNIEVECRL